jgi:hypothetical protein
MTCIFLPSHSVSLVDHSGLLFLSFILFLVSFHLRFRDSIAIWTDLVVNTSQSSSSAISLLCLSFHFLWCPCGLVPILRYFFSFFAQHISSYLGFFVTVPLWPLMWLTSQLMLSFFVRFLCSSNGFYYGFLFGAVYCVFTSHSFSYFAFNGDYGAGHFSPFSVAVSLYLCVFFVFFVE